jgi:hypothetical protein
VSAQETKAIGDDINCGGDGMLGRIAGIDCTEYCKKNPNNCKYTPSANTGGGFFGGQIALNMQNVDFSNFDFTKLANLNLSNIKK